MSGHFCASLVGRGHRGGKLSRSDEHIRFEIVDALIQPEIDGLGCIVRAGELVHLQCPRARAFQIRSGYVDLWARAFLLYRFAS